MLFNSYIFIFLFLPIVLLGYFLLNRTKKYQLSNLFLIGMSLWFYGYFHPTYLYVICGSIFANYLLSYGMNHTEKTGVRRMLLLVGIVLNVAVIFYFKYYDFFISNINAFFGSSFTLHYVVLPLGISFFTFQQLSYLVDTWHGETKDYGFLEYALFVCYFPQLIAGPIVLHKEIIPQFRDEAKRKFRSENFARGLYIFSLGLFKKVLLADTLGRGADWGFDAIASLSGPQAFLVSLCYSFQLYFDFSGYCDMAIGIGAMMNITLPQNFNSPYRATSVMDFWARWHMSLTRFLRQYIYFPLGGSRKGKARTYVNVMLVFLISGIWHGANWTFIFWGVLHGFMQCLNRFFKKTWDKVPKAIAWLTTFLFVDLAWVLFRADSISDGMALIRRIFSVDSWMQTFAGMKAGNAGALALANADGSLTEQFHLTEFQLLEGKLPVLTSISAVIPAFYLLVLLLISFVIVLRAKNSGQLQFKPTWWRSLIAVICLVWSVMSLSGVSTFLYFNF